MDANFFEWTRPNTQARSNRRRISRKNQPQFLFERVNRTLCAPFLRLIRDDSWNGSAVDVAELDADVHRNVTSLLPKEQTESQL